MIFLFTNSVFYDMIIIPHKTKLFGIIARIFNYVKNASSCVLLYRKKFCVVTIPSSAFLSVAQNCCHAFFIIKIYIMEVKDYEKKVCGIILIISIFMTFVPYIYAATVVDSGTCGDNATWSLNSRER